MQQAKTSETPRASERRRPEPIHGRGSPLEALLRTARRVAASEATVMISGETGTGKEVIARYLHDHSARTRGPFVPVNCGAIPEALLESELFGHARGAFTGASTARKGRIAHAAGGTLFLDEIGELPLALQVKLLRVIQERTYEPVGSTESQHADFRLIVATNRDLSEEVASGRFRADLYYRLFVCPLELPPLRDRATDVAPLVQHFWERLGETRPLAAPVMRRLEGYGWPGNVRELENLMQRLSVMAPGAEIGLADLPEPYASVEPDVIDLAQQRTLRLAQETALEAPPAATAEAAAPPQTEEVLDIDTLLDRVRSDVELPTPLPTMLRQIEDHFIELALRRTSGNKKAAADLLGLRRTTLVEKLRRRADRPAGAES